MLVVLLNLWPGNKGSNAYASEFPAIIGDLGNEKSEEKDLAVLSYTEGINLKWFIAPYIVTDAITRI